MENNLTDFMGAFYYGYSSSDADWGDTTYEGPFKETVQLKAGSLEDAIIKLGEERTRFIDSKNDRDANYYHKPTGEAELSVGNDVVYKDSWRRFTIHCVEEVSDAFDAFEHYNALPPKSVYAEDSLVASEKVRMQLQSAVDETRRLGGYTSGSFVVRTEKILDGVGRIVLENDLRRSG